MFVGQRPTPGAGDEAWTEDDVEMALAWQAIRDDACPGCGQPRSEAFHPDSQDAYVASVIVCHACEARDEKSKLFQDSGGSASGLHVTVRKERDRG